MRTTEYNHKKEIVQETTAVIEGFNADICVINAFLSKTSVRIEFTKEQVQEMWEQMLAFRLKRMAGGR